MIKTFNKKLLLTLLLTLLPMPVFAGDVSDHEYAIAKGYMLRVGELQSLASDNAVHQVRNKLCGTQYKIKTPRFKSVEEQLIYEKAFNETERRYFNTMTSWNYRMLYTSCKHYRKIEKSQRRKPMPKPDKKGRIHE